MGALSDRFAQLASAGEKALVLFVTAGDPSLEALPGILDALEDGGADVIEVGIPFSDPIADGPTIQASSHRALEAGATPLAVLETLKGYRGKVPLVLMGYWNPILRLGPEAFARQAREAGVSGTIVSDLIPEEADPWVLASREHGLDNIFLAAPTSTDARITEVCRNASGFVYAVSRTGVTGSTSSGLSGLDAVQDLVRRIKGCSDLPVCVGFGLSRPDQIRQVCQFADGAVVGSWLVDRLASDWGTDGSREGLVQAVRELKEATRG